ncbi:MAG: Xaa-Pro peptidase family protein [Candidatus Acetothermia bacterium]|jgi:Xaa-Pro aminopeptidase|nr:Xaa-Pro peptidase family protein [Candidatus Acetothermia bacterium]MDH7505025.1 Xaa-Pro peptidase family protein [Candidatus Acetothermia bacterium]
MGLKIEEKEYLARIGRVRERLDERGADRLVLFSAKRIAWLCGYHLLATERPVALIVDEKRLVAFIPRLELEPAQACPLIDEVHHYFEYPGAEPPLRLLASLLKGAKRIVADSDGYPGIWGYEGPKLSELVRAEVKVEPKLIDDLWLVKSPAELELIRESAKWGALAHRKLQELIQVGLSELELGLRASYEASREMLAALGPEYGGHMRGGFPAEAGLISGERTALPHAMSLNRKIQPGDLLITGASADIWGYCSELERTLIVGEPTAEQRRFFEIMLEAQQLGLERSGPGVPLAEVDRAVHGFLVAQGREPYLRHHTGHHLGFAAHEPPFIDRNSEGEMRPGQVYSIEPGIYIPGHGGYRHSDTILITEEGVEVLTDYPRDLGSLTV